MKVTLVGNGKEVTRKVKKLCLPEQIGFLSRDEQEKKLMDYAEKRGYLVFNPPASFWLEPYLDTVWCCCRFVYVGKKRVKEMKPIYVILGSHFTVEVPRK